MKCKRKKKEKEVVFEQMDERGYFLDLLSAGVSVQAAAITTVRIK